MPTYGAILDLGPDSTTLLPWPLVLWYSCKSYGLHKAATETEPTTAAAAAPTKPALGSSVSSSSI
jgi:hypothetical protein